ncbi:pre-rRNA processing protein [Grosmannia clavigera kw1407]|uniref:Pre-rRNA processing protein n=1 Tax=Grosmannia clavigera (strain kw1407 / UAMH 11150) TaxID=655863 RepID=F0X8C3_GROCL|nr:pre-rRNA processing protein [Grosmannia clavigera kw1407]EFX05532.1 pre-rRNA processing protein [Grosmannia clavigera kw1407]
MDVSKKKSALKKKNAGSRAASSSKINDARFAKFETDPRFRLPSRRKAKTVLDERFAHMLEDDEFTGTTKIDRYGRKIKSDKKKIALERLYEVVDKDENEDEDEDGGEAEEEEEDDDDDDMDDDKKIQRELQRIEKTYDPARGGGFSESESDSDSDSDSDNSDGSDVGEGGSKSADTQQFREEEAEVPLGEVTNRIAVVNLDWDHIKSRDLMAMFSSFLPKDSGGHIERISIYPSEFGKERMQREELEGPPREIFKKKRGGDDSSSDDGSDDSEDDSEDDEKVKNDLLREEDDEEVDGNALRSYQLDRLRYYYAVMVCSDKIAAEAIYRATDGHEYQASSNFIDLRFIPDDVTFDDDEPRDECTEVPTNYKPVDFVTEALQHSKVKLTWDLHPEDASRKDLVKKAFSGTPSELIENDLRAYLASGSEDEDEEEGEDGLGGEDDGVEVVDSTVNEAAGEDEKKEDTGKAPKLSKKELARQKMRAALGLAAEPTKGSSSSSKREKAVGDMQITFTPALSESSKKKKAQEAEPETTIEKYKRKEKERKEKKRQMAIARREGRNLSDADEDAEEQEAGEAEGGEGEDLGFDDPFFTTEDAAPAAEAAAPAGKSKTALRKEERLKKRAEREAEAQEKATERTKLEELMAEDGEPVEHYDLREVMRAEKAKKKMGKKGKKGKKEAEEQAAKPQKDFVVDMTDPRFQAVFDDPEFAIDPSNPRFKNTPGIQQVLTEMRRKRRGDDDGEDVDGDKEANGGSKRAKKPRTAKMAKTTSEDAAGSNDNDELASLVKSVKRKAKKP